MLRDITSHKVNGLNDAIEITVLDESGDGGACHQYLMTVPVFVDGDPNFKRKARIDFQKGPIEDADGVNGFSNEALLAIVEDRLKGFQSGQYACRENALALTHLQESMHWLHHRTRDRVQRGVEGTHKK